METTVIYIQIMYMKTAVFPSTMEHYSFHNRAEPDTKKLRTESTETI